MCGIPPCDPARSPDTPDLAGLLFDGLHCTLHRAQQRLDLIGRLLQEEAGHKLVHVAPALVHLCVGGHRGKRGFREPGYRI